VTPSVLIALGGIIVRRVVLSVGLSVALLFSAGPGLTQTKAAPPTESNSAAKSSEKKLALARRMFEAMHFDDMVANMLDSMDPLMAMGETGGLSDADSKHMRDSVKEAMNAAMPEYVDALTEIYADAFTEEELQAMVDFYESPIGQSVLKKSNEINEPVMAAMMDLMPEILVDTMTRFCSKTECSESVKGKLRKQAS
jgi:hypothetical protein